MSLILPTGPRGQILAGALTFLVAVFVWLSLIAPALEFYGARRNQVDALRAQAAGDAALIEALPRLVNAADVASRTSALAVLNGNSDAIAGATLQEQVQNMASSSNAQLTSIETLPSEQAGNYRRIGVRVELTAQFAVAIQMIEAIEQAQPSMLLDDIRLNGAPVGTQNAELPLDATFTVYAFRVCKAKEDLP